jgi:hypothetical protein
VSVSSRLVGYNNNKLGRRGNVLKKKKKEKETPGKKWCIEFDSAGKEA